MKKRYRILLVEDILVKENEIEHFKERTICELASDDSYFPGQAYDIHFTTKIDGTHSLTFKLPSHYFDIKTEKTVSNALINYLTNKVKIRLHMDDSHKTYYFVINDTNQEESDGIITYSYECGDSYIEELAKSGYNLRFTKEDGLGDIHSLAKRVAEGTEWEYAETETGTLYEYSTGVSYNAQQDRTDTTYTLLPSHKVEQIPEIDGYAYKTCLKLPMPIAVGQAGTRFYIRRNYENIKVTEGITPEENSAPNYVRVKNFNFQEDTVLVKFRDDSDNKYELYGEAERIYIKNMTLGTAKDLLGFITEYDYKEIQSINSIETYNKLWEICDFSEILSNKEERLYIEEICSNDYKDQYKICLWEKPVYATDGSEVNSSKIVENILYNGSDFTDVAGWTVMPKKSPSNVRIPDDLVVLPSVVENDGEKIYCMKMSCENTGIHSLYNATAADSNKKIEANTAYFFRIKYQKQQSAKLQTIKIYSQDPLLNLAEPVYELAIKNEKGIVGFSNNCYYVIKTNITINNPYIVFDFSLSAGEDTTIENIELFKVVGKESRESDESSVVLTSAEENNLILAGQLINGASYSPSNGIFDIVQLPEDPNLKAYTHHFTRFFVRDNYRQKLGSVTQSKIDLYADSEEVTYYDFFEVITPNFYNELEGKTIEKDGNNKPIMWPPINGINIVSITSLEQGNKTDPNMIYQLTSDGKYYQYYEITNKKDLDGNTTTGGSWGIALLGTGNNGKNRTLVIEKSNRFNIIQELSELFKVWPVFEITELSNGDFKKRFYFKESALKDNFAGFHKGINLKSLSRQQDSDQIVTKMYVEDQPNEYLDEQYCSIRFSTLNPSGENFLYDFSHYVDQQLLAAKTSDKTKYVLQEDLDNLYHTIKPINQDLIEATQKLAVASNELSTKQETLKAWNLHSAVTQQEISSCAADLTNSIIHEEDKKLIKDSKEKLEKNLKKYEVEKTKAEKDYYNSLDECQYLKGKIESLTNDNGEEVFSINSDGQFKDKKFLYTNKTNFLFNLGKPGNRFFRITGKVILAEPADGKIYEYELNKLTNFSATGNVEAISHVEGSIDTTHKVNSLVGQDLELSKIVTKPKKYSPQVDLTDQRLSIYIRDDAVFTVRKSAENGTQTVVYSKGSSYGYVALNSKNYVLRRVDLKIEYSDDQNDFTNNSSSLVAKTISFIGSQKWLNLPSQSAAINRGKGYIVSGSVTLHDQLDKDQTSKVTITSPVYYAEKSSSNNGSIIKYTIPVVLGDGHRENIAIQIADREFFNTTEKYDNKDPITYGFSRVAGNGCCVYVAASRSYITNFDLKVNRITGKQKYIENFENKYSQYIKEGVWSDSSYTNHDAYYLDAEKVLQTSARPEATWNISVLDGSVYSELKNYKFEVGDKTFLVDDDFFSGRRKSQQGYKFSVIISQIEECLDNPTENNIEVRNHLTAFEDLFQRISATTQALTLKEQTWDRGAYFTPDAEVDSDILQKTLSRNAFILSQSQDNSYTIGASGFELHSISNPQKQIRVIADGIFLSNALDPVTAEPKWSLGITADGINASIITTGELNTEKVSIFSKGEVRFRWNALGITAYDENDNNIGLRIDKYGIYQTNKIGEFGFTNQNHTPWFEAYKNQQNNAIEKIINKSNFSLTRNGFNWKAGVNKGTIRLGQKDPVNNSGPYGLWVTDPTGAGEVISLQSDGNSYISGWKFTPDFFGKIVTSSNNRHYEIIINSHPQSDNSAVFGVGLYDQKSKSYTPQFGVTLQGYLYANNAYINGIVDAVGGTIGGWTLSKDEIYSVYANSSKTKIYGLGLKKPTSATTAVISSMALDYDELVKLQSTDPVKFAKLKAAYDKGIGSSAFREALAEVMTKFKLTANGKLIATDVDLKGIINATSGSIGGWTVSSSQIKSGNIILDASNSTISAGGYRISKDGIINNNNTIKILSNEITLSKNGYTISLDPGTYTNVNNVDVPRINFIGGGRTYGLGLNQYGQITIGIRGDGYNEHILFEASCASYYVNAWHRLDRTYTFKSDQGYTVTGRFIHGIFCAI